MRASGSSLVANALSAPMFATNTTNNYTGSTTGSVLTGSNWSLGHVPTVSEDAVFTATTGIRTQTAGNLTVGSFNVTASSGTFSIRNQTSTATNSLLTLGGAGDSGNGVSGTAGDLLFVASGATFQLLGDNANGTGVLNVVLGQSGNFDAVGTMSSSAVISDGGSAFGITKTGAGTLTLSGVNTYSGDTTINAGSLSLSTTGSLASANIIIGGGGTFNISTRGGVTLNSGQGLQGSGTATTGTITTAASNGLTTASDSPLKFTAFNGTTAPLTISGPGTVTVASGNPVTVTTTSALGAGDYTLIAKGATGSVAGIAPTSLTVNGSGLAANTVGSLLISGNQLVLHVVAGSPPSISKTFNISPINVGFTAQLTIFVNNPNSSNALTGVGYTDTLPAGLTVPDGSSSQCSGTLTIASNTITLAGATVPAGLTCSVSVNVTATAAGTFTNNTSNVTSGNAGTGNSASAQITVLEFTPPTISYTAFSDTTSTSNRTLAVTVTDDTGVPTSGTGLPVIYFRKGSSGAYTSNQCSFVSGSSYSCVVNYSLVGGAALGNTFQYYVLAQDSSPSSNVASNPSTGANGFTSSPPSASPPTTAPNSYVITCPGSLTVNDTGDGADAAAGDGVCATAGSVCTLRAAIQEANALSSCSGAITINFSIGSGVQTITPASIYPAITRPVIIDGTTQAGSSCTTAGGLTIELNGTSAGSTNAQAGLQLDPGASGSTIKGLVINRFGNYGMFVNSSSNNFQCNYLGTNVAGTSGLGNHNSGIRISGNSNVVGGSVAGNGNLISGNSGEGIRLVGTGTQIQGNYVGTNAAGTAALPNGGGGVDIEGSANTTVGGATAGARNLISGNTGSSGVVIATSSNTIVQGNYIGTDATGTSGLGNKYGVNVNGGATIGGIGAGEGNIIAFNITQGIVVFTSTINNSFRGNSIYSNGGPGIDLGGGGGVTANDDKDPDTGPNNLQNFPVLTPPLVGATTVSGTLNSTVGATFIIDVYSNDACDGSGNGEGKTYLGSTTTSTTDSNGNVSFNVTVPAVVVGKPLTATASDSSGTNTSEFSACVTPITTSTISGQVLTPGGLAGIGSGRTVTLLQNGTVAGSNTTDVSGNYSISGVTLASGDKLAIFIDAAAEKGATVTLSGTSDITNLNIWQNSLIVRTETGTITNANLKSAQGGSPDADLAAIYTVDGSNNLTTPTGVSLQIWSSSSYQPGGDINDGGDWTNNGTFTAGAFTVKLNSSAGNQSIGGNNNSFFNNLTISNTATSPNNVVALAVNTNVGGVLTVSTNGGVFDQGASFNLNLTGSATNVAVIQSGGTWRNLGTGGVTLNSGVSNAGTINFNANGTPCGGADSIQIRSSVSGTQRTWSSPAPGTGTFSMTDVDVQDQKVPGGLGTFPVQIVVNSGTGSAANNTGWTFVDTCTSGTYTWIGGANQDWTIPTNWTPTRLTPNAADVLIFDGANTPSPTVTNVPTETDAEIDFQGGVLATWNANTSGATLTVNGANADRLKIPTGNSLTIAGSPALQISIATTSKAAIAGTLIMLNGSHRMIGADVGSIIFSSGSIFTAGSNVSTGFAGNPFGAGTNDSVRFQSGSTAFFNEGSDPFGGAGKSVATFNLGSFAKFFAPSAFSFDDRSYGYLTLDGSQNYSAGSATNKLTVLNTFELEIGSSLTLSDTSGGDLILLGAFLDQNAVDGKFIPNGRTVKFNGGSTTQTISKAGGTESFFDVFISETAGGTVQLLSPVTINGQLNLSTADSVLELNGKTLALNGTVTGSGNLKGDAAATLNIGGTGALTSTNLNFLSGSQSLSVLTMNRTSSGSVKFGNDLLVDDALNLTNGTVDMGSFMLTTNAPNVSRTNGWIIGKERRFFGCNTSCTIPFDVGTGNGYSPVSESFLVNANVTYNQTVSATQGPHPNIPGSNALQRYWTLNAPNPGIVSADITFKYRGGNSPTGDIVGNEANYKIFKYNAGFTKVANQSIDTGAHTATVTGVTSFSDWTLAETSSVFANVTLTKTDSQDPVTEGNNFTYTITAHNGSASPVTNLTVTDPLPGNVTFVSSSAGCTGASTVTCTQASVAVNADAVFTITVTPTNAAAGTTLQNTATVTADQTDPNATISASQDTQVVAATCATPPAGMVAWYPGDGNADDIQGPTSENGTLQNGATFAPGKVGQAFNLNGTDQFVEVSDVPANSPATALSIDAWIKPNHTSTDQSIVSKYDACSGEQRSYELDILSGGAVQFAVYNGQSDPNGYRAVRTGSGAVTASVFTHVAATFDTSGQVMKIYINGVDTPAPSLAGSVNVNSIFDSNTPVDIGRTFCSGGPGNYFNGLIDEVELFNTAISAPDVKAIYDASYLGKCRAAEIDVKGNNNSIADGSTPPSATNDTDFGSVAVSTNATHTFTIYNTGTADLNVTNISVSGGNASDFSTGSLTPASPIAPLSSATFTVTFTPGASGPRTTTVHIANDDSDEGDYDFEVGGNGTVATNPPSISSDGVQVTVNEGDIATKSGTFDDADGRNTVTITAKIGSTPVGTINKDDPSGTWSWSYTTTDGPENSGTVVITADDGTSQATTQFSLVVNNVAPTIALSGNSSVNQCQSYSLHLGAIIDPGTDTVTDYTIDWGDGNSELISGNPVNTDHTHSYNSSGNNTISVSLTDEDGAYSGAGTLAITVNAVTNTFMVNTPGDAADSDDAVQGDGICETAPGNQACTLRAAIEEANLACPAITITFDANVFPAPSTIVLRASLPALDHEIAIIGPGVKVLTIDGAFKWQPFHVNFEKTASISALSVADGKATDGGGVWNEGTLTLKDVNISNNRGGRGAGINNDGTLTVRNAIITDNIATKAGGGIRNAGTMTLINSVVMENSARKNGGGIHNDVVEGESEGTARIFNSTIVRNTADASDLGEGDGGGIYNNDGSVLLVNTIVAQNDLGFVTPDDLCGPGAYEESSSHNLIGIGGSGGLTNSNGNQINVPDPLLNINGVPVSGSPAIDAGDSCVLTLNGCNGDSPLITTDQRGVTRPQLTEVDIGAFEVQKFVVNTTADPGDGICTDLNTGDGCTLREAITAANNNPDSIIAFDIPPDSDSGCVNGVCTISPGTNLPAIITSVFLDGYSQKPCPPSPTGPCSHPNTLSLNAGDDASLLIVVSGVNVATVGRGLDLEDGSDGSTIRGLVINHWNKAGIYISNSSRNTIAGNFIGTDATGAVAAGASGGDGVLIVSNCDRDAAENNIGGDLPELRNLISGNGAAGINIGADNGECVYDTVVEGNYIGTDHQGLSPLANAQSGIIIQSLSALNTIGCHVLDGDNLISGNTQAGIDIRSDVNNVIGNFIGTDRTGIAPLGNSKGIIINGGQSNVIGLDPFTGDVFGNLISGNADDGVAVLGSFNAIFGNYIGVDLNGSVGSVGNGGQGVEVYTGPATDNIVGGDLQEGCNCDLTAKGLNKSDATAQGAGNARAHRSSRTRSPLERLRSSRARAFVPTLLQRKQSAAKRVASAKQSAVSKHAAAKQSGINKQTAAVRGNPSETQFVGTGSGANIIAGNTGDGVRVSSDGDFNNQISQNSIFSNGGLGINLGTDGVTGNNTANHTTGPNHYQNFPVITSVDATTQTITGTLNSEPNNQDGYLIEFFVSPLGTCDPSGNGEGKTFIGALITDPTDANGDVAFTFNTPLSPFTDGDVITTTATDYFYNTSEFSACFLVRQSTTTTITNASSLSTTASVVGEPVEVDWTVVPSGTGTPTGTVSVTVDGNPGCNAIVATGKCTITPATQGVKSIVAHYTGDSFFGGSDSASTNHTVNKANTTTTITNSGGLANATSVGSQYEVDWSVTINSPGDGTLTGTVNVTGDGSGCSASVSAGKCFITPTTSGVKSLVAHYGGDGNFLLSDSSPVNHVVNSPSISGHVDYCITQSHNVPGVLISVTGSQTTSTTTDSSGNYSINLPEGGNYTLTPTKAALAPLTPGIDTADVVGAQRHFLGLTTLTGCEFTAADATEDPTPTVDTADVIAIQRFFLGANSGTGHVGEWQFNPANQPYSNLATSQTGQDYAALVVGDVTGDVTPSIANREGRNSTAAHPPIPSAVATVSLPIGNVSTNVTNFTLAVTTSNIDPADNLVGFQGDFTFDSSVVTFQATPASPAGLTASNWNVSANILGAGTIKTLRISAFSTTSTPLSGSGTLFNLNFTRVSNAVGAFTDLTWASSPNNFVFIDTQLVKQAPGSTPAGKITIVGPTAANGNVSGQILDGSGAPVEGAAVRMSGTQNRLTITDAQGNYHFDNVETNGLYVVTPSRSNFTFSPSQRTFSQLGAHTEATFTGAASANGLNPLDTTEYFVRQQYLDFLGREPDESGFNFWVNNIDSCGADSGCREAKRVDTSAAFFLSIEFQQTGYLVYRAYESAYGNLDGGPVPMKLSDFTPDTREISNGVVVLQDGWQQKLENNKRAFIAEFVQRPRFGNAYPISMTPAQFVDKLFANAHVPSTDPDYAAALTEFGTATDTADVAARARVLRRVAENSTLTRQQFTQAFVLMQYFGYLQRDPNSGRDADFTGYNFWLEKLDRFSGNFENAEMVKAFLSSVEYRARFPR
jgi:CSLREA domain-containing protein